jgi:Na+/proline symporter
MAIVPDELYKRRRRHNNTPKSTLLIIANCITIFAATSLCVSCNKINSFFWYVLAGLVIYNFFTIRRNLHEFNKPIIIAYCLSLVILFGVVLLFKNSDQGCVIR